MPQSRSKKEQAVEEQAAGGGGMTAKLLRDMERERKAAEQPAPTPNPSSVFIWPSGPPTPPKEDEE